MSLPDIQPPPRTNDPAELHRWLFEVRRRLIAAGVAWTTVDKTGSSIADIENRSHTLLTDIGTLTHTEIESAIASINAGLVDFVRLDGTTTMTGDLNLDNHDLFTNGRVTSGSIVTSWINNLGDTRMGTYDENAGEFQMIQGAVAGDPTFTITQLGDNVTINQTVGGLTITCASGEISFDDENLTTTGLLTAQVKISGATDQAGTAAVLDATAATASAITDNTGGTAGATVADGTAAYSQAITNDNIATLTAQVNALIADNASIRTQLNTLLAELRKTNGCGILSD